MNPETETIIRVLCHERGQWAELAVRARTVNRLAVMVRRQMYQQLAEAWTAKNWTAGVLLQASLRRVHWHMAAQVLMQTLAGREPLADQKGGAS